VFQLVTEFIGTTSEARNIVADVSYERRPGLERKHSIKRRHPVNLGGSDV
jgi:hypothetical protein